MYTFVLPLGAALVAALFICLRLFQARARLKHQLQEAEDMQAAAYVYGRLKAARWYSDRIGHIDQKLSGQIPALSALLRESNKHTGVLDSEWRNVLTVYPDLVEWEKA